MPPDCFGGIPGAVVPGLFEPFHVFGAEPKVTYTGVL